jgi:hypothetical protein
MEAQRREEMSAVTMTGGTINTLGRSALDIPISVTFFRDHAAQSKRTNEQSLRALIPMLSDTTAPSKAELPWLKLATFGDVRTQRGSLRHDENITAVTGIEADYDGEAITVDRARQILANAGIAAIIYTSPSHTEDTPRWRVLCPLAHSIPSKARAGMVARLNGLFVGALATESFTASQAYYYGSVRKNPSHEVVAIEGRALDEAPELDDQAVGRPVPERQDQAAQAPAPRPTAVTTGDGTPYALAALSRECAAIRGAGMGQKWATINRAAYSIGGIVTAGELHEGPAIAALRDAVYSIRGQCEDFQHALRTLETGFADGKAAPRHIPEAPRLIRRVVEEYEPRPEPQPRDAPPDHWIAEPEPDIGIEPERLAPDIKPTGLPLIYFQDVKPALKAEDFVEGLLIKAAMSVTYGPSNCGKTFFMADLALHVALGLEWRGREVDRAGVIYCAMEGAHGIANRVAAFALACGLTGQEIPFAIIPVALNLLDPEADTSRLIDAIAEAAARMAIPVGLVVMDTLSRAMAGGNENSAEDMGALVVNSDRIRQATGAHVAWIHHSGKDQAQGARGHSLLRAATDTEIEISRADNDGPSVAKVTKQRELEIDGVFGFTLKRVELGLNHRGKPVTSCIVEPTDERPAKLRISLTNGEAMALRILHDVMAAQPVPVPYQASQARVQVATSKHAWRETFFARSTADSHEAKKKAFNRAADGLAQKGQIGVHHDTVWAV